MASRSFVPFLKKCCYQGYQIKLLFLWLQDVGLAIKRVKDRVAFGGHSIPSEIISRRYKRCLMNFFNLYMPLAVECIVVWQDGRIVTIPPEEIEVDEKLIRDK
jgi:predicted ABC-type ATPase